MNGPDDQHIDYEALAQNALRGIVRKVLDDVVAAGGHLPGEHHFYICFDTRADGVIPVKPVARTIP